MSTTSLVHHALDPRGRVHFDAWTEEVRRALEGREGFEELVVLPPQVPGLRSLALRFADGATRDAWVGSSTHADLLAQLVPHEVRAPVVQRLDHEAKRLVVLGAGRVGAAIAWDLRRSGHEVTVVDASDEALARLPEGLRPRREDLSDPEALRAAIDEADVVVGALPSRLGLGALHTVLEAGRDYVDISFLAEDPLELAQQAERADRCVVVDCGVAPGISNLLTGYAAFGLDACDRIEILVGGLPVERRLPWQYKAPFAPVDVLEEYTRPARIRVGGEVVVREALSGLELVELPGVGSVEAFYTDGLRSLLVLDVPDLQERTLRWPGHMALAKPLRDAGFFDETPLELGGQPVSPRELTSRLLFPVWEFEDGEADLVVMRVSAEGWYGGARVRWTWDLLDHADPLTGLRSMSRCTAFPASIVASRVATGGWRRPGVHAPEVLAHQPEEVARFLAELALRGVEVRFTEEWLETA